MAIKSFTYDGISLNEFDNGLYVIAFFDTGSSSNEGERTIERTSMFMGKYQPFIYQKYEDTLTFSIGLVKNPCLIDEMEITVLEMENLKRWLCRPIPGKFKVHGNNDTDMFYEYEEIYWEGTFNLQEINLNGKRVGVTLEFISTRPYALQEDTGISGTVEAEETIIIDDNSAEIGYIYPDITIRCLESGDLTMYNSIDQRATVIKNCSENEIITFSKELQIQSSNPTHDIYNDFNFIFLRISNDYYNTINEIAFSLNCEYEITYNPIRKVLPV